MLKSWNYSPYNYSELFKKPVSYSKKHLRSRSQDSKKLYNLMIATEGKSALDYFYWNNKMLYLTANKEYSVDFEKSFQNAFILSKNNDEIKAALRLFYSRNITQFSEETKKTVLSK